MQAGLVQRDVAAPPRGGVRQLRQHHQFRHRRQCADRPDRIVITDRGHQLRRQLQRQAFIAAHMVVAAHILVARPADQDGAGHQFEMPPARAIAEAALAHERDRGAIVPLHERLGAQSGLAPVIVDAQAAARRNAGHAHAPSLSGGRHSGTPRWGETWRKLRLTGGEGGRCQPMPHQSCAAPTVSAILAPRAPSGLGGPVVLSLAVWCSISAFSSPPSSTMVPESQLHTMKAMTAPSEP